MLEYEVSWANNKADKVEHIKRAEREGGAGLVRSFDCMDWNCTLLMD